MSRLFCKRVHIMGLFDWMKPQKSESEKVFDQIHERLFPGGDAGLQFKAQKVFEICNGKLNRAEAGRIYATVKTRLWLAETGYDGEKNLGPDIDSIVQQARRTANDKLSNYEVHGILYYAIFDKIGEPTELNLNLIKWKADLFGSERVGCCLDEVPGGIGEFGYVSTNPIPVRGLRGRGIYLERLRTRDLQPVTVKNLGCVEAPNVPRPIDEVEVSQGTAVLTKLYISAYNQKISERPPTGFILLKRDTV